MRNFIAGIVAALVLIPAAVLGYYVSGCAQTRSDLKPSAWETRIMTFAVRKAVRHNASRISKPELGVNESINTELVAGGKLYVLGCVGCHGDPAKPFKEDHENFPPAPQLPHVGTQYSDPELYWVVKHGIRMTGMSAYGPFYSDRELWSLAAFLRRINNLPPEVLSAIQTNKK